ncbi:MAG: 16S rRNA (cytosine(1402)-N(4))-methyltransferase RsmH [bacterium]
MEKVPYQHTPVMPVEVINSLNLAPGKTIVDCTLGGGGHTEKIKLQIPNCKIIAFDQDGEALTAAKERLRPFSDITYIHSNFAGLKEHLTAKADGFLFDLGVSSYQLDEPERGFSIRQNGPLDMRMNKTQALSAFDIINTYSATELEAIILEYSQERFARRISQAIVRARETNPIKTTEQLKIVIEKAIPTWKKRESITRVFQALRIVVNNELETLKKALNDAIELLNPGGRIVVIAYHSLEDRIVKQTFRAGIQSGILKRITKKPLLAQAEELAANPRAGSAKLRAAEKI